MSGNEYAIVNIIWFCVALYINYSWGRAMKKTNEDWKELCEKINQSWKEHFLDMIEHSEEE